MEVLIWILVLPLNSHYDSRKTTCVCASDFSSVKDGVTCFNKPSHFKQIYFYLFEKQTYREKGRDFSSSGILSRWLQQPKVSQEEVGNQELHPGARPGASSRCPTWGLGAQGVWPFSAVFRRCMSRELDQKYSSWDSQPAPMWDAGRHWLYLLYATMLAPINLFTAK